MPEPFRVVVIGAGFSGVMTAVHLLRSRGPRPFRVLLCNRSGAMARGVAYGTQSPGHLLNVPAGRMSAFPDDPGHFLRFCQSRAETTAGTFVARSEYGQYLAAVLAEAIRDAGANGLDRIVGDARELRPQGDGLELELADGRRFSVDHAVLAVGHHPPAEPAELPEAVRRSASYIRDPWVPGSLAGVPTHLPVLLLGTGLTMLDVAIDLKARGVESLLAVSRRGLLPQRHDPSVAPAEPIHRPASLEDANSIRDYLAAIRAGVEAAEANEGNWRQVIDSIRPITPLLWQRLSVSERERFLRHLRPFWDAHRHRAAPATMDAIERFQTEGWLTLRAARLVTAAPTDDGIDVTLMPRGAEKAEVVRVGAVVNCTGPVSDLSAAGDPLLNSLFAARLARLDPLRMGIDIADGGAIVDADGGASAKLSYVGPLLRARDGEGTAVPELRVHAANLAARLFAMVAG